MAFVEQFIYLCLRHFWVLQAASHRFLSGSDTFDAHMRRENQQQESVPEIIKQTIRTYKATLQQTSVRVEEDICITDRTSGGVAAELCAGKTFPSATWASVFSNAGSLSAPLVGGLRA